MSHDEISELFGSLGITLQASQLQQVSVYLDLLMRWNQRINLTSTRDARECLGRHFGESLFLARWITLDGSHLDIGSGAGFPGLVLKIAFPALRVTLLEPIAKKRAFLKEVARSCGMISVEVRPERLNGYCKRTPEHSLDSISCRAVGRLRVLVSEVEPLLKLGAKLCLWVTGEQANDLAQASEAIHWDPPIGVPGTSRRVILIGNRIG
jgi:16S rRNA (guanine527-N7)-methyltransferase